MDIVSDYWLAVLQPIVFRKFGLSKEMSFKAILLQVIAICAIFSLIRTFVWKEGNLFTNFLYWPIIISIVAVVTFPIFWLGKNRPKVAFVLNTILLILCGLLLGAVAIVLILGLCGVFR